MTNDKKLSIGIDFGATKIVAAICDETGEVQVVTDENFTKEVVSCVTFTEQGVMIGGDEILTKNVKNIVFGKGIRVF